MRVAIIDNDRSSSCVLKDLISDFKWSAEFFKNPKEFGGTDLLDYDVVIADYTLPGINGRDLLKSLSGKTHAQMLLMGDSSSVFSQEDIENNHINGFINKSLPESFTDQLRYIDSKIRINKLMEKETNKIKNILSNGHTLKIQCGVGVLEIVDLPAEVSIKMIEKELEEYKICHLVTYFSNDPITSSHIGLLIALYKIVKEKGGRFAFWNKKGLSAVERMFRDGNLNNLFDIFDVTMIS